MSFHSSWNPPDAQQLGADALNAAVEFLAPIVTDRTPRLTGDLRGNTVVHHASPGNLEAGITVHSPYARYQHELETPNRTEPGTSGHFVEGPWMEHEGDVQAIIGNVLRGGMT